MTDFETATLTAQYATAIAQVLIGIGQIAVVWYGISRMVLANDSRATLQRELMERQERESERRHAQTMTVLTDQGQALRDQGQALQAMIRGLDKQGQALETLIVRTGTA